MRWLLVLLLWGWGCELAATAQDLTGQWSGDVVFTDRKQKLVLNIASGDSSFGGVLHWYFPESHYIRHFIISGRYYGKDSILTIREDSVGFGRPEGAKDPAGEERSLGRPPGGFYVLYYKRIGHKDILEGHWRNPDKSTSDKYPDLSIRLEKKIPPFIPVVLPSHKKKDSVQQKQNDAFMGRSSVVAALIPAPRGTDSIRVDLYDNGEIDGDSVSLYLNNQLIVAHVKLSAEAKTLFIPIDKSLPVNKLVLFAENMGKLPPNTALMEVTIHGKTYELFLSTDFRRNASVEFSLQE
jgi:hypothetical protein